MAKACHLEERDIFWVSATKGTEQIAPGEAGLDVQKILDGVYRSAENGGKEVAIK